MQCINKLYLYYLYTGNPYTWDDSLYIGSLLSWWYKPPWKHDIDLVYPVKGVDKYKTNMVPFK